MARYFAPITKENLIVKIADCENSGRLKHLTPKIEKDLSKVQFDTENEESVKYHTLDNGLTFLECWAGGDWEAAVTFIIYWDGRDLRGYIPTKGNTWNTVNKQALGNDVDDDAKFLSKLFPREYAEAERDPDKDPYWKDSFVQRYQSLQPQLNTMIEDIKSRILPSPLPPSPLPSSRKPRKPRKPRK